MTEKRADFSMVKVTLPSGKVIWRKIRKEIKDIESMTESANTKKKTATLKVGAEAKQNHHFMHTLGIMHARAGQDPAVDDNYKKIAPGFHDQYMKGYSSVKTNSKKGK